MKECISCHKRKRATSFYVNAAMSDGRLNKCKFCCRQQANKNRSDHLEEKRAYDRRRANDPLRVEARRRYFKTPAGRAATKRAKRAWDERNKHKKIAQWALNNALRDGKITKPNNCNRCDCSSQLEGHHNDYSRPLEVEWLCSNHHKQVHKEEREKRRNNVR